MRSRLTAPPLLFWEICLPAMLAGGWAIKYPGFGGAGLLLIMAAAWPFLRENARRRTLAGRLGILILAFALGFSLASRSLPAAPPLAGEKVRAVLRIREMRGFSNPGVSDNADRQLMAGVFFRAYSVEGKDEAAFSGPPALGQATRQVLYERFMAALGDARDPDAPGRAALPALFFGDRSYLSDAQTYLFAKASLSHSLALSGLHLGFMAALGWFLARFICRLFPGLMLLMARGKWAALISAPLVLAYLWVGGAVAFPAPRRADVRLLGRLCVPRPPPSSAGRAVLRGTYLISGRSADYF